MWGSAVAFLTTLSLNYMYMYPHTLSKLMAKLVLHHYMACTRRVPCTCPVLLQLGNWITGKQSLICEKRPKPILNTYNTKARIHMYTTHFDTRSNWNIYHMTEYCEVHTSQYSWYYSACLWYHRQINSLPLHIMMLCNKNMFSNLCSAWLHTGCSAGWRSIKVTGYREGVCGFPSTSTCSSLHHWSLRAENNAVWS